jgi:hypothetical protein
MKVLLCQPNQKVTFQGMKARPMVRSPLGLLMIAGHPRSGGSLFRGPCHIFDVAFVVNFVTRLDLTYPHALVHAAKEAIGASR